MREVQTRSTHGHLMFLLFLAMMELCVGVCVCSLFGGCRQELCRTRKDLEKDIFPVYGDTHFRQPYQMEKESADMGMVGWSK